MSMRHRVRTIGSLGLDRSSCFFSAQGGKHPLVEKSRQLHEAIDYPPPTP